MSTPRPGHFVHDQVAVFVAVVVREDLVGQRRVRHQFLDAEVGHPQPEVHGRGHAHRRQVGRAVEAGAHLVHRREVGDAAHVRDAAGVHDGRADVVDQLLADQVLAVPDRVEDFADRQRRGRVLADQAERLPGSRPASRPRSRTGGTARVPCRAGRLRSASAGGARRAADACRADAPRAPCGTAPACGAGRATVSQGSSGGRPFSAGS